MFANKLEAIAVVRDSHKTNLSTNPGLSAGHRFVMQQHADDARHQFAASGSRIHFNNFKYLKAFVLVTTIISLCCFDSSAAIPVPFNSCGKQLAQRIYSVCLDHGGICSFPTRTFIINHNQNRRVKRKVVEECCRKACLDDAIKQYCCDSSN